MKEYYCMYKEFQEDVSYKYVIIKSVSILKACQKFQELFPDKECDVIYNKSIYPFLKPI